MHYQTALQKLYDISNNVINQNQQLIINAGRTQADTNHFALQQHRDFHDAMRYQRNQQPAQLEPPQVQVQPLDDQVELVQQTPPQVSQQSSQLRVLAHQQQANATPFRARNQLAHQSAQTSTLGRRPPQMLMNALHQDVLQDLSPELQPSASHGPQDLSLVQMTSSERAHQARQAREIAQQVEQEQEWHNYQCAQASFSGQPKQFQILHSKNVRKSKKKNMRQQTDQLQQLAVVPPIKKDLLAQMNRLLQLDCGSHVTLSAPLHQKQYWCTIPTTQTAAFSFSDSIDKLQESPPAARKPLMTDDAIEHLYEKVLMYAQRSEEDISRETFTHDVKLLENLIRQIIMSDEPKTAPQVEAQSRNLGRIIQEAEQLSPYMMWVITRPEFWSQMPQNCLVERFASMTDTLTECATFLFTLGSEFTNYFSTGNLITFLREFLILTRVFRKVEKPSGLIFSYVRARYRGGNGNGVDSVFTWLCMVMTRELATCKVTLSAPQNYHTFEHVAGGTSQETACGLNLIHTLFGKISKTIGDTIIHWEGINDPAPHLSLILRHVANDANGPTAGLKSITDFISSAPQDDDRQDVLDKVVKARDMAAGFNLLLYFWQDWVFDAGYFEQLIQDSDDEAADHQAQEGDEEKKERQSQ